MQTPKLIVIWRLVITAIAVVATSTVVFLYIQPFVRFTHLQEGRNGLALLRNKMNEHHDNHAEFPWRESAKQQDTKEAWASFVESCGIKSRRWQYTLVCGPLERKLWISKDMEFRSLRQQFGDPVIMVAFEMKDSNSSTLSCSVDQELFENKSDTDKPIDVFFLQLSGSITYYQLNASEVKILTCEAPSIGDH